LHIILQIAILTEQGKPKTYTMLNEEVRRIMTKNPVVVSPDSTIAEVSKLMMEKVKQQIPVVKNGKLVGLITSYDLWKNSNSGFKSDKGLVKDIMTTSIIKIAPKDKVGTAAELFMDKRFKTLPVVNLDNDLKGIVTAFDVIKHVMTREYQPSKTLYPEVFEES